MTAVQDRTRVGRSTPWYEDRANLVELLHWLRDQGHPIPDLAIDVLQSPYQFEDEFNAMRAEFARGGVA